MKCKHAQDLILTEYLDLSLLRPELKSHLESCAECRQFEAAAREVTMASFEKAERLPVPERLWEKIKNGIETEEQWSWKAWLEGVRDWFFGPQTRWALAPALALVIIVVGVWPRMGGNSQPGVEEPVLLASLIEEEPSYDMADKTGYGTNIERYFLL